MRKVFLSVALAAALTAPPVLADSLADDLVGQLHEQGYPHVDVSRTLLGRIRLLAENSTQRREIIVNPRTGEILRDYSELLVSDDSIPPTLLAPSSGTQGIQSGSNSSGSNSGSGSSGSNSGSGSSGSGSSGSGSSGSGSSGSGSGGSGSGSSGGSGGHGSNDDDDD